MALSVKQEVKIKPQCNTKGYEKRCAARAHVPVRVETNRPPEKWKPEGVIVIFCPSRDGGQKGIEQHGSCVVNGGRCPFAMKTV